MTRILYFILLAAAALFFPLYKGALSLATLLTLLILPVLALIRLAVSARLFDGCPPSGDTVITKGSEGEVCIRLTNRSVFALSGCGLRIRAEYAPSGEVRYYNAAVPVPALSSQTASVNINALHCGSVRLTLEYVTLYDEFRLFSVKRMKNRELGKICIIPDFTDDCSEEGKRIMRLPVNRSDLQNGEFTNMNGSPGDVTGYREFAPGDKMSSIHYKLSARFDKDIVKVMPPVGSKKYLLSADLSEEDLSVRDVLLEKMLGTAKYLTEQSCEVYAAVPEDADCEKIYLDGRSGCGAARLSTDEEIMRISCILCETACAGTDSENGYIVWRAEKAGGC